MPEHHDLVIVANRLPVTADGSVGAAEPWTRSPGGLVSALETVLRDRDAAWVGWSGRIPGTADAADELGPLPDALGRCALVEVELGAEEVAGYYEGFSNSTLWPLYHDAIVTPVYHRHQWEPYVAVNRRFADAVVKVAAPGATVWVHDYQLQLVPAMLRAMRPDLRIGFFLHIPFPPIELFLQLPWRREVLLGLLGADLVGFQTAGGAANFRALVERVLGVEADGTSVWAVDGPEGRARRVEVDAFPISVDTAEYDAMARSDAVHSAAADVRARLGNPRKVLLGVDRMDYTKGIDLRLKAFTELLADGTIEPGEAVLLQVATPSRENVEDYERLRDEIDQMVGRALGDHGTLGSPPIVYLHQQLDRETLVGFYSAADVMLVTPYRDGMNLVAKEYVASRFDDDGALILSEFTGAATELTEAYLVNPYDAEGVKQAIRDAMSAKPDDLRRRMHAMREYLAVHDVARWASSFLDSLERSGVTR